MQLCSLYNAHFSEIHSDNVLVEESKNVKIMGIISMEPPHLHDQYAHELFSLGSLALTCISWGKISSSKEEISIYDPEFLLWQQQFIPLDCPEVFEALAYACCDVNAPELPSLTYITEQLTSLIPDVKAWEEQLEKQQRAVLHSDAMGAARTAKRFSILFNADEFHEQLTHMPATFDQSENGSLLETPSRLSGTAAPMNQRRASHRAIRPSLYVPRTAPAGPPDSSHTSQESDVPVPLLRLNGQLLELEYELAQSVQDLENPFVRMEWEQHNPEALHRVLGSIQHCMKHIRSHINHLQSAITNESMAITDDVPVRIDEDTVHNHVPSFAQRSPSLSSVPLCEEEGYISPPESIPTVLPPGSISSATTKLFAALEDGEEDEEGEEGEEEGNEDEHSTTENRENGESPVSRRESGQWSPAAAVADDAGEESPISPSFEDTPSNEDRPDTAAENVTSAGDATITTTTSTTAPVPVAVVVDTATTMKKQTSLRTLAFVSGEVSERETLHPQPTHAVASEASPASVTWSTTLANPTLLRGNLQVGDEGAHEMAEVVVTPPPKLSRPPSSVVRRHSSTSIHPTSTPNSRAHSRSSSFVAKAREEIELKVSGKSPLGSCSGSPRATSTDAPFPPPPPPPPPSTKSSSQAPSPASSLPSSRRPSASGTTTTATAAAHHPPPPPPPPSRRTSLLIDAASMVGYETHEMMVEDTLTLAALPVESSPSSEPSSHAPIEATSLETPPVVPIPPPPPPPKRPSVTMAPVPAPAPAPVVPPPAEPSTVSDEKRTFSSVEPPVDVAIAHDSRPLTTDDLQLPATRDPDSSPSVGSESSSPADHRFSGGEPHRQAVRWSETTDFAVDAPAAAFTVAAPSAGIYDVKASSVRVPPPISTAAATLDVPLSSLTSPLASASHFLDRIRHLDEMFSTMTTGETGTGAMSSEEKRRSPIGYHHQQPQPSSSGHHHSAHSSPSMMAPPTYAGGGGGGGYVSSVSPQYSPYGGGYGYPHGRSTDYAAGAAAAAAAGVSPSLRSPPPPSPSSPSFAAAAAATHNLATMEREQAQNTQIHQTFQMYLSLVQRCSNTSARAKQVLDHLDQQMATVSSPTAASYGRSGAGASSSLRRPHSFAAGSAGSSSSSSYGGGTRSSPTHQVAPSYMQPIRSSRYGGESSAYHSGVHRTPSADASSMGGGALSRSSSYSNLRTGAGGGGSVTSGSYMVHGGGGGSVSGMLPFAMGDDPAMPLRTSSSSGASVYSRPTSSASSSRSNSNQRGRNTTAVRSPIAKEILSNRPNPRVYSISPRKQR
eukprot:gene2319-1695_t